MFFTIAKDCTERLSAAASEKNRELLQIDNVYRQRVLQTVTSLLDALLVFRAHDLLKITNINPQQENQTFAIETISSPNIWGANLVSAIRKIKVPQKFRATRYLSTKFITLRVLTVQLAFTI